MITRITDEDLDFIETLFNPIAAIECLFSDIESENLAQFDERFCEVRLGQFPLLSYEYLLDDDPNLSSKENFKLREGCGTVYVMGGRKFGKTLITEKVDLCLAGLLLESEKVGFTSFDAIHIRGILEDVIRAYEQHPILKTLQAKVNRHPNYRIVLRSGFMIEGINMNLTGKRPGEQFFQKHLTRLYIEEASFETELIYKKRIDAVSENGCVIRATGMTNFTKYSPAGKIFYDLELQPRIVNLPQYVSPKWDAQEEKEAVKKHSGRQSVSYRVFVKGEVVEEGVCVEKGTKILMSDGSSRLIEDVCIGDILLSFSENPPRKIIRSRVLDKIDNGVKQLIEIKSGNNRLCLTSDHHVVSFARKSFSWNEIQTCLIRNYPILSLKNLCADNEKYYWGALLGIIESDGTRIYDKGHSKYSIYITQSLSCEYRAIEYCLKRLNLYYSRYTVKQSNPKYKDMFRYCISRRHNSRIEQAIKDLCIDRETTFGFLAGFIIGDGGFSRSSRLLYICQSERANSKKCRLIEKVFRFLHIDYFRDFHREHETFYYYIPRLDFIFYFPNSYKSEKYCKGILNSSVIRLSRPVKQIGKKRGRVFDLVTDSGTFIANGFLVHNSVIDMERVRKNYIERKVVKHFEISKDTFFDFENELVVERLKNAVNAYIAADIGESAPTEIMIFFEVPTKDGNKYLYTHNITLYNLTDKQQFRIFRFLSESLKGAFIGIDTSDGTGRAIFRSLEEVVPRENMVWVSFSKKIPVGFEKDDKGNVIFKNGLPVYREEYVSEWSIKRMKYLLYEDRVLLPLDYKLDMQLNSLIAVQSGTRTVYQCVSAENHLLQAFQCFAIIQWDKEFKESKATHSKKFSKLGAY